MLFFAVLLSLVALGVKAASQCLQQPDDFLWLVIVSGCAAFNTACGIGANDVANAFATSVGSKALTLRQAVCIAAVCEFLGAVTLGASVTNTIKSGILSDPSLFIHNPQLVMLGMFTADLAAGIWLIIATRLGLPVSTTHSIIGGVMGFAVAAAGTSAVQWSGVGSIVASWIISPVSSGCIAALAFYVLRSGILRSTNSFLRARRFMPFLIAATLGLNLFFMMYKGASQLLDYTKEIPPYVGIWICLGIGAVFATAIHFLIMPKIFRAIEASPPPFSTPLPPEKALADETTPLSDSDQQPQKVIKIGGLGKDIHETDDQTRTMHDAAEQFDYRTEKLFHFVQIVTACFASFAHGANDVANAIAPLAANVAIYQTNDYQNKADVPIWILLMGGTGIVLGLSFFGWKVIKTLGVELTTISPARGFTIQLISATTVICATLLGMPISTTHCQVGATFGVGLTEGRKDSVNWKIMIKVFCGWGVTLVFSGCLSAILFAVLAYSPTASGLQ